MSYTSKLCMVLVVGLPLCAFVSPARAADPEDPNTPKNPSVKSVPKAVSAHRGSQKKPAPIVLPPLPTGPLQQVPMDQIPESAPKVTFENGLLTISAKNSTLGEILKQVKELTGATIDLPASGAPERVVTQLGPAAPRDVLAALLNGTQFNYVLLGSAADPSAIASVTLTSKPGTGAPDGAGVQPPAMTPVQQAQTMPPGRIMPPGAFRPPGAGGPPQADPAASADAEDNSDDADDSKDDDADQAQPAQAGQGQADNSANQNQPGLNPNQPNAGPRTPEQLLQMMRQGQQPGAAVPPQTPPPQEQE